MAQSLQVPIGFSADKASLDRTTRDVKHALGRITGNASEFQKSLDASTARVFAFGATTAVIQGVNTAFKALVGTTIDVEKRMIEISSIFGGTASSFAQFRESIFQVAKDTGQSFTTVADAAAEFARQGLSAAETTKRLNAALVLTQVSGLDSVKSVKTLTAAINGYQSAGLTAEQITNKLVAVDTKFAVSAKDLSDGLARAGSTAEDAGVGFDELLGIITAVEQRTSRGGAVIGNALKTIFTRISRPKIIEDLQALGVAIDNSQSGVQKLQAIGAAFEAATGDTGRQSAIKELAAGGFQINVISAALKDLTSNQSAFTEATKVSVGATDEAFKKSAEFQKSLAANLNSLIVGFTNLAEKIGSITLTPILGTLAKIADKAGTFLNDAFDPETGNKLIQVIFKSIGAFISGPGLVLIGTAFFKIITLVSRYAKEGFKSVLEIGTQTEKLKVLQEALGRSLLNDDELRKKMLSTTISQLDKEKLITAEVARQNKLHFETVVALEQAAKAAQRAGIRPNTEGYYTNKAGKPVKAAGFAPSFAETVAETSAAREHGYKAGKVFNTKLYDGKGGSFEATVNSAEKIKTVRGPNGKLGTYVIPPNGMAARGFVPNYAKFAGAGTIRAAMLSGNLESYKKGGTYFFPDGSTASKAQVASVVGRGESIAARDAARLKLSGAGYGMLIPNAGFIQNNQQFQGSVDSKPYVIDNLAIRGPDLSKVDSIADPQDELLKKNLVSKIIDESAKFANSLGGSRLDRKVLTQQLSGQSGARGAINSAVGAAFEASVLAAYPSSRYSDAQSAALNKIGGDFDLRNVGANVKNLFNLPTTANTVDFKASPSRDNISSFVGKMIKEQGITKAQKGLITKGLNRQQSRGNLGGGFVPNFAAFKKNKFDLATGNGIKKARSYTTDAGSSLSFIPNAEKKRLNINYIKSNRKGDAYALFQYLAKVAKRTKSTIYSSELLSQKDGQMKPFAGLQGNNWERLLKVFPQLKYRDLPKSQTSLAVQYGDKDATTMSFNDLGRMEDHVNNMDPREFERAFKEAYLFNVKTKMFGQGFIPNFVSPNALKSLQLRASYKGGDPRLLAEAANARRILSKQQNKGGVNLRTVFDKLDGESGISQIIDSAFTAAGPTASNEDVFRVFEAQTRQNPQKLRELVKRRGFVPNFSAIQDAISREKKAGIPASAIYVDQNPQLKSTRNPSGLMVANRIDEPLGGYQGIARAKKEGKNPKSYGAGKGFVPNYAEPKKLGLQRYVGATPEKAIEFAAARGSKALDNVVKQMTRASSNIAIHNNNIQTLNQAIAQESTNLTKKGKITAKSQKAIADYTESLQKETKARDVANAKFNKGKERADKIQSTFVSQRGKIRENTGGGFFKPKRVGGESTLQKIGAKGKDIGTNSLALSFGLSTLSSLTGEVKDTDSALAGMTKSLVSTTAYTTSAGAAFGPYGAAIGAATGLLFKFNDALEATRKSETEIRKIEVDSAREAAANVSLRKEEGKFFQSESAKIAGVSSLSDIAKKNRKQGAGIDFGNLTRLRRESLAASSKSFETSFDKGKDSKEAEQARISAVNAEKKYTEALQSAIRQLSSSNNFVNISKYIDSFGDSFLKTSRLIDAANQKLDQQISNLEIAKGVELNNEKPLSKFVQKRVELQQRRSQAERNLGGFRKEFFSKGFSDALKEGLRDPKILDLSRTADPLPEGFRQPSFTGDKSLARLNTFASTTNLSKTAENFTNEFNKASKSLSDRTSFTPSALPLPSGKFSPSFEDAAGFRSRTQQEIQTKASIDPTVLSNNIQKAFVSGGESGVKKLLNQSGFNTEGEKGKEFFDNLILQLEPLKKSITEVVQANENYKASLEDSIKSLNEQIKNNLPNIFTSITKAFSGEKVGVGEFSKNLQKALSEKDLGKQGAALKALQPQAEKIQSELGPEFFSNLLSSIGGKNANGLLSKISGRASASQFDTREILGAARNSLTGQGRFRAEQATKALEKDPESRKAIDDLIRALKEGALGVKGRENVKPLIAALEARKGTKFGDQSGTELEKEKNLAQQELARVNKELGEIANVFKDSELPNAVKNLTDSMRQATESTNAYNNFATQLKNLSDTAIAKMGEADKTIKNIEFRLSKVEAVKGGS